MNGIGPGNVRFSYAQLMGLWIMARGSAQTASMAAAIAMAESSLGTGAANSAAYNKDTNGSTDRGLWQINSINGSWSSYDIMTNARGAVQLSHNGTDWHLWTTYKDGSYRAFLRNNVTPDMNVPINATNAAAQVSNSTIPNAQLTAFTSAAPAASSAPVQSSSGGGNPISSILKDIGDITSLLSGQPIGSVRTTGNPFAPLVDAFVQATKISIINPLINIAAGLVGMTFGVLLTVYGAYLLFQGTETGQATIQGRRQAVRGGARVATFFRGGIGARGPQREFYSTTPSGVRQRTVTRRVGNRQISTREQLVAQANEYGQVEYRWQPIPHRQPRRVS